MGNLTPLTQRQNFKLKQPARRAMERETGIEPASLAWKARVLPLNYSRIGNSLCAPSPVLHRTEPHHTITTLTGGGDWIRTSVGVSQQIYSLPPLATRAPLRRISNYSTKFLQTRRISRRLELTGTASLVRLAGIEPTTLGFGGQYSIH